MPVFSVMGSRQTSRRRLRRAAARLLVGWGLLWIAVRGPADEPSREAFDVVAPVAPTPVRMGRRSLLVYELHCTNFSADDLTITSLEVTDAERGRLIASFAGAALAARLQPVGRASAAGGSVAPRMSAAIFVECAIPGSSTPRVLAHQLRCRRTSDGESFVIAGPHLGVDPTPPVVLGAPVRGGPWVAVHHPDWPRGHRRVFYAIDGRARLPGRFAIDWVKVDGEGRVASGRAGETQSFFGYGADVLAVADASVAAVRDGMAESARVAENPPHALGEAAGNFVSLALPGGPVCDLRALAPGQHSRADGRPGPARRRHRAAGIHR